ncbi:MAG: type II secretion system F family protein [Rhodospirillales bacterium]|nr:type II secretion system F family protein [Rhodospirillales bacterium]
MDASWLSVDILLTAFAGVAAFTAVMALALGVFHRDPLAARIARISGLYAAGAGPRERTAGSAATADAMRGIVERLNLVRGRQARQIAERLARAGWRSNNALVIYMFLKLSLPVAAGLAAIVIFYLFEASRLGPMGRLAAALGMVVAGAYLPELLLRNAIDKRRDKIRKALPDALDLMVICAEAGLSLDAALGRVTREIGSAFPELADELGLTSVELRFLSDRREALQNLGRRVDLSAVQALANTLTQTERFGTPLSQSLRVLSAELRNERMMRAEEKAARLPAIMTVPLIVFILPALFVVLMGPAILGVIDALAN